MKIMLDKNEHMFYNANKCNITVSGTIILLKYGVLWKQIREMCREDMEMSERNVKFQYFGLVRQEKEGNRWTGKGKLNISVWMDKLDKRQLLNSTIDLGDVKASLDKVEWFKDFDVWVFRFMKLREDNIPSIVKENQEAEAITLGDDEYIGEGLHMLYDCNTGIAMVQVNRFSLGLKRLEDFLTSIWNVEKERIKLRPIIDQIEFDRDARRKYKAIEISFANISHVEEEGKRSLGAIMNSFRRFCGVAGNIKISFGRTKGDTLNIDEINEVVEDAMTDKSVVGLKLHIKDDDDRPVEVIDLFDNICKDIITFNLAAKTTLNYDYAAKYMIRYYEYRKEHILGLIAPKK